MAATPSDSVADRRRTRSTPNFGKMPQTASEMAKPTSAAEAGDQERLEQELPQHPPLARAERHLDPDLPRPLLDDDVHDVRDADPADDEREGADDAEEEAERQEEDREELELLGRVPDREGFLVLGVEALPLAEDLAARSSVTCLLSLGTAGWKMMLSTHFSPVSARNVEPGMKPLPLSRPL